ncbi:MAG: transglutaminase-like domain-containing protein [Proteobacteria bacterium]|nr:transglutaminase-like domain-containing protein [Pseudomonadota bacterium]
MSGTASQTLFAHIVNRPDDEVELDVAALLIGEWEYERLDVARYLGMLDHIASAAERRVEEARPFDAIRAINRTLFEVQGFRGNLEDYYDPRNSFLCEVLDRRTGIPITLSVLYIEVARRMGVSIRGVSFPGHFLVRYDVGEDSALIIDPFRSGEIRDAESLQKLLQRASGDDAELTPALLAPVSKKDILVRMLTNLVRIYSRNGDVERSIEALQRVLILEPHNERVEFELDRLRDCESELN